MGRLAALAALSRPTDLDGAGRRAAAGAAPCVPDAAFAPPPDRLRSLIRRLSPIEAASEDRGIDLEAEVAVLTDYAPMGIGAADAGRHVKLVNDVTTRALIPDELAKGFGFVHGKPASASSPVRVGRDAFDRADLFRQRFDAEPGSA